MSREPRQVKDKRVRKLTRRYLEAGLMEGELTSGKQKERRRADRVAVALEHLLNHLDRPLEQRGHSSCANDCNLYVRSQRRGQRVMEGT